MCNQPALRPLQQRCCCPDIKRQLTMLRAALLSGSANLRMYGCEAFFIIESSAKLSTRSAVRLLLLAATARLLNTAAGRAGRRQHGRCIRVAPIIFERDNTCAASSRATEVAEVCEEVRNEVLGSFSSVKMCKC